MLVSDYPLVAKLFIWILTSTFRVLIHPNTNDALRDHTEHATWMGMPFPLNTDILKPVARFGPNAGKKVESNV